MDLGRFLHKCLHDRPAAWRSLKLVARSLYGGWYWKLFPHRPLRQRIDGGVMVLPRQHYFTHCFFPGVDQYEPDLRAFVRSHLKPGGVFVDCGANVGLFSVIAKARVGSSGRVVAIEPNPLTLELLTRNLQANAIEPPMHAAVSDEPGEVELLVPRGQDVFGSLRRTPVFKNDEAMRFAVTARKLDDIAAERGLTRIDLIKIDVEGAELMVLRSARDILTRLRPVVTIEYGSNTWPGFGATPQQLFDLLEPVRYHVETLDGHRLGRDAMDHPIWRDAGANLALIPQP